MRSHLIRVLQAATIGAIVAVGCGGEASPDPAASTTVPVTTASRPSVGDPSRPAIPTPDPDAVTPNDATDPSSPSSGSSGVPLWTLALVGLLGAAAGAAGGYAVGGRRPTPSTLPAESPRVSASWPPASPPPQARPPDARNPKLDELIAAVIGVRDLMDPSSEMARRLGAALGGAGVSELAPLGQPFDPQLHEAVQNTPTTDASSADMIAEVQRVGYRDARHVIRPAEVVVYRLERAR